MDWEFDGAVSSWLRKAPPGTLFLHFFVETPPEVDDFLRAHLGELTYGWGVIPARVGIGATEVTTSLIPKDDVYLVPLKVALRRPEGIDDGDTVRVRLSVGG